MAVVSRYLKVTQGNIDNHHIYLTDTLNIFPDDVFGGSDESQAASQMIRVQWGAEIVETDIDRTKNIFRKRGWVARFFDEGRIQAGDTILLEQLEPYLYRISKVQE
jgi:hypothetical protein